jgi:hypothetical protein
MSDAIGLDRRTSEFRMVVIGSLLLEPKAGGARPHLTLRCRPELATAFSDVIQLTRARELRALDGPRWPRYCACRGANAVPRTHIGSFGGRRGG